MTDVGGQRNHRRKWIHCFDSVTAIIYCVALNEYDMVMREDPLTNRMHESLQVFESLVNSNWFSNTDFIIFFNKYDLFTEKITRVDLNQCFPAYSGGKNIKQATKFIEELFKSTDHGSSKRNFYFHFTTATDTSNIKTVWNIVQDILMKKVMDELF